MQHDETTLALVDAASHLEQAAAAVMDANELEGKHVEDFKDVPEALVALAAHMRVHANRRAN